MRGEQDLGGRRLEGDPALDAEDRVAEVDAAADAERAPQRLDALDERDRVERLAVERDGNAALEGDRWRSGARGASKAPRVSTQADSGSGSSESSVSLPPIVVPQRPRLIE